ncbi:MAG: DHH family phosphoesterase [Candidatus Jordarchaeum sp.]|uniref:DHH family phosphoesterase n=1 Tax=Candidatus Jordarchaeum sp. TaxID=2823881 RepID=UPI00404B73E6
MALEIFKTFFENNPKKILILCHQNADPDALCSAYAIKNLIANLFPEIECLIGADDLNKISSIILEDLKISLAEIVNLEIFDAFIAVDTNNVEQLGCYHMVPTFLKPIIFIDHHTPHIYTTQITQYVITDETSSSTAEIVYKLFKEADIKPDPETAMALLLGITYDSKHFLLATGSTFKAATDLIDAGADYPSVIEKLRTHMPRSERIARLKAMNRMQIHDFKNWLVTVSNVSAYEASACRALMEAGADIAIVGAKRKNEIRISARATQNIHKKTGINLGKLMEELGTIVKGVGGGHSTAAGFNGEENHAKAIKHLLKLIEKHLENSQPAPLD